MISDCSKQKWQGKLKFILVEDFPILHSQYYKVLMAWYWQCKEPMKLWSAFCIPFYFVVVHILQYNGEALWSLEKDSPCGQPGPCCWTLWLSCDGRYVQVDIMTWECWLFVRGIHVAPFANFSVSKIFDLAKVTHTPVLYCRALIWTIRWTDSRVASDLICMIFIWRHFDDTNCFDRGSSSVR